MFSTSNIEKYLFKKLYRAQPNPAWRLWLNILVTVAENISSLKWPVERFLFPCRSWNAESFWCPCERVFWLWWSSFHLQSHFLFLFQFFDRHFLFLGWKCTHDVWRCQLKKGFCCMMCDAERSFKKKRLQGWYGPNFSSCVERFSWWWPNKVLDYPSDVVED